MGCYTSIIHPETGVDYQIKTGYDNFRVRNIGDEAGDLPDGVYDALGGNFKAWLYAIVIIRDGVVLKLIDSEVDEDLPRGERYEIHHEKIAEFEKFYEMKDEYDL